MCNLVFSLKHEIRGVAQENSELKRLCEKYSTVVYQMGHDTEDLDPYFRLTDPVPDLGGLKNMQIRIPNTVFWENV